jgi:hypothetical protein
MAKDPIAFDLDIAPFCIAVETTGDSIDVQISPSITVLIKHEISDVAHIHEVLTCVRG